MFLDQAGIAWMGATRHKLHLFISIYFHEGWSPEEAAAQYPALPLPLVHGALACYFDHQAIIGHRIEADEQQAEKWRKEAETGPVYQAQVARFRAARIGLRA